MELDDEDAEDAEKVRPFARRSTVFTNNLWKPGQSANPSGRPKRYAEHRQRAIAHADEALDVVLEILRDPDAAHTSRLAAADFIWNRAYGKPKIEVESNTGIQITVVRPQDLTPAEIAEKYASPVLTLTARSTEDENDQ